MKPSPTRETAKQLATVVNAPARELRQTARDYRRQTGFSIRDCVKLAAKEAQKRKH
jgi:hypothetical protein